jgi:RHS repeat-associated protein
MVRAVLCAALRRYTRSITIVVSLLTLVAASATWAPRWAEAQDTPKTPVPPPGAAPVDRPLPASALPNHGYPKGQRPPVVPPETPAGGKARHLTTAQWAAVPKPATRRALDGGPPPAGGATDVLARPGFELDDTSLVVYFNAADPGLSQWASWLATVYDPDTQAAQDSKPMAPAGAALCQVPRTYCRTFGSQQGWTLVDGHPYIVTITVTLKDGSQVVSAASAQAKARTTASPPPVPAGQAAGCTCPDLLAPTAVMQAVRGSGEQTGTGAYTTSAMDLRMAGFGVTFQAVRQYSSTNTTAGTLGLGWSWTYDARVIPPAAGQTAVTVRAEDGAQAVYQRADDGSYTRPPGVRSVLSATGTGWRLVTPDQVAYSFDQTGRLMSIQNSRGLGTTVAYTATKWTITDAAGRKVTVDLDSDGLVRAITLPDGRAVKYQYQSGQLSAVVDASGATWKYAYTGGLLTTVTDPQKRVQVTNTYAGGRVSRQVDAAGAVTQFEWKPDKQEAITTDADGVQVFDGYKGNILVYTQNGNGDAVNTRYDPAINRNLVVDPQGNQTVKGHDGSGNVTAETAPDPFGFSVTNTYDGHNNVTGHTDGLGHSASYGYTATDELETSTTPTGGRTVRQVDSRGLVTSVTDPRGKVTTMTYDAAGNLVSQTSPMGEKTTYAYDGVGRRVSQTDPRGNLPGAKAADFTTRYVYDNLDRLRKTFAPGKERPTESVYDDLGQLTKAIDPLGDTTTYTYAKVIGRATSTTDPEGGTTSYEYTIAGRRRAVTDGAGNKTTYSYDLKGNLATIVSARGNAKDANPADFTTTYIYDTNDNLVRTEHAYPGGGFIQSDTRYDELNRPVAAIDPLGKTTSTSYDNNNQLLSTVDPVGRKTSVGYDPDGRQTALESPAGGRQLTEYDPAGHPVKRTSATGGVTTFTYNDDGLVATMVDPLGNVAGANPDDYTTAFAYDAARNQITTTDPLGGAGASTFDANNRLVRSTDANGHVTSYRYDDADRLVAVTGPDAVRPKATDTQNNNPPKPPSTTYTYDKTGRLVSRTDPNGHTIRYGYDRAGRLVSTTDPLDRRTTFGYDAESDLTSMVAPGSEDPAPRSIVMTYDILGRRVGEDLGHGGTIYAWGYDAKDRNTSLADPAGLRIQTFDDAGRLTKVSRDRQTFTYEHDADGNVTTRTWPDGTTVKATFDADDRMSTLTAQGGVAGNRVVSYSFGYDPADRPTSTTGPGGVVIDRGYDRAGRLVDVNSHDASGILARYQLGLDPAGNPTTITTTRGATSQAVGYTYDPANRVTSACVGGCGAGTTGKTTYAYDLVGNRTSQTRSGSAGADTASYSYDAADELTRVATKANGSTTKLDFAYDGQGNKTKAGADTFTYNLDRTLASATVGGVKTTYAYDAQRLQLSAVSNIAGGPRSRSWAVDVNAARPQVSVETTATPRGTTSRGFLPGPAGDPLALLTGGQAEPYLPDWLGGIADVLSPDGKPLAAFDYDPYGNARADGTAGTTQSAVDTPIRFAGMYQDSTLGNQYSTQLRAYDPSTGRFDGSDSVAPPAERPAVSGYAYAADRPITDRDPTGADPCGGSCPEPGTPEPGCDSTNMYSASCEVYRGFVITQTRPTQPPRIWAPPKTDELKEVKIYGRRGWGIVFGLSLVLMLGGDSAPDTESYRFDENKRDDRSKNCLDEDGPPEPPFYYPLDNRQRAQGAEACLGPWSVPVNSTYRPAPPGLKQGMDRSHLLPDRFGGLSIRENIVPMYGWANKSQMATVENRVGKMLAEATRVYFQAIPVYPTWGHPRHQELGDAPVYVQYHVFSKVDRYDGAAMNVP